MPNSKPNLLLLHGALGTIAQFDQFVPLLAETFTIHQLEFEGHGQIPLRDRPLNTRVFVENVLDFLIEHKVERTHIFGHSLGGYVAIYLAQQYPARVDNLITLGTRFRWDAATVARESKLLDVETIKEKVPHFAQRLAEQHVATNWEALVRATVDSLHANANEGGLPPDVMAQLNTPLRIIVGDRDATAEVDESYYVYQAMLTTAREMNRSVEFQVLPNTPHPFDRADLNQLADSIKEFLG